VGVSYANVSFSHVCVSSFFVSVFACRIDTPFFTVYEKADKGNKIAIIKKDHYDVQMQNLIDEGPQRKDSELSIGRRQQGRKTRCQEFNEAHRCCKLSGSFPNDRYITRPYLFWALNSVFWLCRLIFTFLTLKIIFFLAPCKILLILFYWLSHW
jgi:hypothetical protein